jgi:hypothetical protein
MMLHDRSGSLRHNNARRRGWEVSMSREIKTTQGDRGDRIDLRFVERLRDFREQLAAGGGPETGGPHG